MLVKLYCDHFQDKFFEFHSGLNVVLGDENATNSIGKSTLLMVIDFVFGGDSFITFNTDVVQELGHHPYKFCFEFNNERHYFIRHTDSPDLVAVCDEKYDPLSVIKVTEFTSFLKRMYSNQPKDISFRAFTGLFSRVWGKPNDDVRQPLHTSPKQSGADCVNNLLKIFDVYSTIDELTQRLKSKKKQQDVMKKASNHKLIPKINKTQYKENLKLISALEEEIRDIKSNLAKFAMNISEIANKEIMQLKIQKDELLKVKFRTDEKLARIRLNIKENRHITSKHLQSLEDFFPNVNVERIAHIEEFHSEIVKLLKQEMKEAERGLSEQSKAIAEELHSIDQKMSETLSSLDNPSVIVDRIYNLSTTYRAARQENNLYEESEALNESTANLALELHKQKRLLLDQVQDKVNDAIERIVTAVFGEARKSPVLKLKDNNYSYEIFEDTGTGTAYSNIIVFDLAIFEETPLPIVIHDSFLFKNIENSVVGRLVSIYRSHHRQSFIAIDEIRKYGHEVERILRASAVAALSDDHVLYRDWRKKS